MGLFKDVRGLKKQAKDMQKATGAKRPSLREGLQQASSAMADVQQQMETQQHLAVSGTTTTAIIEAVRPTGTLMNNMPVVQYDLRVDLDGTDVQVSLEQAVPQIYLQQLILGATTNVIIDAADTDKVMLSFT